MSLKSDGQAQGGAFPRTSDSLCRHVLDRARDVVFVVDRSGAIVDLNASAASAYGYTREELLGKQLVELRSAETLATMNAQLEAAFATGILFETVHVRADGSRFPVEVSSRGIALADGPGVVSIVRDISDRRADELQRESLLAELAAVNARLDSLVRIMSGAMGTLKIDELLAQTLELLRAETDADAAIMLEAQRDGLVVTAEIGDVVASMLGHRFESGEGFGGRVALGGAPLYVPDVLESSLAAEVHERSGFRSMFGLPMYLAGELYGVLELGWAQCRHIDEDGVRLVQASADRVMLAVANAQLYRRARAAEALSAALNDLNSLVNSSFDQSQTMDAGLAIAAAALGCDVAVLALPTHGRWEARYAFGVDLDARPLTCEHWTAIEGLERVSAPVPGTQTYDWLERNLGLADSLTVRLAVRGRQVGLVVFGRREAGSGFDALAREYAQRFADAIALAVANAAEFESEHRIAETLQEALLTTPTSVRGVEFGHLYRSATLTTRVGGDFYDLFELAYGRVAVVIGDVSGKGLEAAVLTSVIKDTIRAFAHDTTSPADVMARANTALGRAAKLPEFASVLFAIVDTRTATLTYCCAGHPPAAVIGGDGAVRMLECTSPVIGAFEDLEYTELAIPLAPDQRVFLYTDGVTEARRGDGTFFGDERLAEALAVCSDAPVAELPSAVYGAVMAFTEGRLSDDIALLAFRLLEPATLPGDVR